MPLDTGPVNLLVEVVPFLDPNFFLVKQVYFKKDFTVIPFLDEFHLQRRKVVWSFNGSTKKQMNKP
ncbi:hypothetical protein BH10BAC2_BH10BAC2_35200 [soil metagenome]